MASQQQYLSEMINASGRKDLIDPHTGQPMQWGDATSLLGRVNGQGNTMDNRLLSMAGLWKPEYDNLTNDWGTDVASRSQARQAWQESPEYKSLTDSLKGYTYGEARKDYTVFDVLRDPQGNVVAMQPRLNKGQSFHKDDYANMISVMLGGYGAAAGGATGVGSSLYGLSGTSAAVAGGATLGAVNGAVQANANDQNVLGGAVKGGVMGGAAAYVGSSMSGGDTAGANGASLNDVSFQNSGANFGGGSTEFGSNVVDPNALSNNYDAGSQIVSSGGGQSLPTEFSGVQQTSGAGLVDAAPDGTTTIKNTLPESSAPVDNLPTSGQASEPSLADVKSVPNTSINGNSNGLQEFLRGNGNVKDYIQLGGLVASVAARPKAADTSGINDAARANAGIAERQQTLAEKQYADQLALFNEYKPLLTQQLQNTIAEQAKSTARSDQQWDDYTKTWLPIGQTLAQKSTDWASPGRMQQAAQEAQAGVATQYDTARQQSREQMIAAGLDPSTIATIQASTGALEAKDRAGAANTARRTVEQQGMAYLDNAARFGRNMTSIGLAAAGLAGQQGSQATNNYASLANASAAPAASANPLFNSAVGSNSSAGGLYGNAANINNQQSLQNYNQMMGTIAGVNQWYQSSKKTKKVHGKVKGAAAAVEKSGASRWSYKEGMGDGNTKERMGPMAEDLSRVAPSVSNGKVVDAIAMSGLHHAAIGENTRALREQNKRLKRIEKNLSLADA